MNSVSLQVIGCGDAFGSGGQINTCFYVKSESVQLLIDCGATSLPALKKYGVRISDLDLIVLSHFHGDHFGGVAFLLLQLSITGQTKPLTIVSPPGCREKLRQLLTLLYPGSQVLEKLKIEFIAYGAGETIRTKGILIDAFPVVHTRQTLPHGVRIQLEGKTISYSGDTGWTENLLPLAANADLFICECNFFSTRLKGHLNYRELMKQAPRLTCRKILLTHFGTEMLDRLEQVKLDYATAGRILEV